MTYNVFGGTLSLTQSINHVNIQLLAVAHTVKQHRNVPRYTSLTGSTDRALKDRVANPWGKTVLSSTYLPTFPDSNRITCV